MNKNRRNFLKTFLIGSSITATAKTTNAQGNSAPPQKETLLTEDGLLVEIDKSLLNKIKTGQKVTDKTIMNFIQPSLNPSNDGK